MKPGTKIISLLVVAMIVATTWLCVDWYKFFTRPLIRTGFSQTIKIYPGTGFSRLKRDLTNRGLLTYPRIFTRYAKVNKYNLQLRFGEYWIKPGMTAPDLLKNMVAGKGMVRHKITFIEGWTFLQFRKALLDDKNLQDNISGLTNLQLMKTLNSTHKNPEGLFFPSTYRFKWGNSDLDVLQLAYQHMKSFLAKQWAGRAKGLPYKNVYQALIVASLIEKETGLPKERALVASVILNRLHKGMRLQVDPTVLYGINKSFGTPITKKDLRNKNPYNTYVIYGLPPTPIDNPSAASIIAALHPASTQYYYYVSSDKNDGSHIFSKNYRRHKVAVKEYRRYQRVERKKQHWREVIFEIADWFLSYARSWSVPA